MRTPEEIADAILRKSGTTNRILPAIEEARGLMIEAVREAQAVPATVTASNSDRHEAARELADHLEEKMKTAQWMTASEGTQAVHALRALIEAPAAQAAPTFKVENLDRDARTLTAAANLLFEAAHLREISYAGHPRIKECTAEARRVLGMLSSGDADQ